MIISTHNYSLPFRAILYPVSTLFPIPNLEPIRILPIQIHHPILKPRLPNRLLKVLERRQENIVITNPPPMSTIHPSSPFIQNTQHNKRE